MLKRNKEKDDKKDNKAIVKKRCEHCFQKVQVGEYNIFATAAFNLKPRPQPNLGIYFSTYTWGRYFKSPDMYGGITGFKPYPKIATHPSIIVDWTDGIFLDFRTMDWLIDGVISNFKLGKVIEIGCDGGHGRTGSFLSCLIGKVEGKSALNSILSTRMRYCKDAVETITQIQGIADYLESDYPVGVIPSKPIIYNQWCGYQD